MWGREAEAPPVSRADAAELDWWRQFRTKFAEEFPPVSSPLAGWQLYLRVRRADGLLVPWAERFRRALAELADFESSDGHRHDCPRRDAPPFAAMPQGNLSACDCAAQIYALAARAEEDLARRRLSRSASARAAADSLEMAASQFFDNPCVTHEQMLRVRAAEYRQARSIDNGMET